MQGMDKMGEMQHDRMTIDKGNMVDMNMDDDFSYAFLKSPDKTTYPKGTPVKEILLNLTGNMNRYIWSINGVHHPMHLHGHFFRVINKNGEYSPLKHTVNVPPMQQVTIEFYGNEYGDWFFHCHVLYHMMSGMTRVFSYDTPRDKRMEDYPLKKLIHETDRKSVV